MEIKDIMGWTVLVHIYSSLEDIVKKMSQENVNSVLVVDEENKLMWSVDIVTIMKAIVPEYISSGWKSIVNFITEWVFEWFINDNKSKIAKDFMFDTPKTVNISSPVVYACIMVSEWTQTRIPVVNDSFEPIWILTRHGVKDFLANKMGF